VWTVVDVALWGMGLFSLVPRMVDLKVPMGMVVVDSVRPRNSAWPSCRKHRHLRTCPVWGLNLSHPKSQKTSRADKCHRAGRREISGVHHACSTTLTLRTKPPRERLPLVLEFRILDLDEP
jgi:hypothetical protein